MLRIESSTGRARREEFTLNKARTKYLLEKLREECTDIAYAGRVGGKILNVDEEWFVRDLADKCEEILEKL